MPPRLTLRWQFGGQAAPARISSRCALIATERRRHYPPRIASPYQVVSTYGDSNAITRAELRVEPGKVVEATLNHRAATVTLKLVRTEGGEAFAGTAFSVLTPGGDVIREAIGAFPSFILAEGDYVVIARHEGQVYTREFRVASGLDREIEVTAK